MFSTLYSKLAAVLLLLFTAAAGLVLGAIVVTTRLHLQEVNQRFNRSLAGHLAASRELMHRGEVDEEAAADIFHMLMEVNPAIEIYLLDGRGEIRAYSAPPEKIRRSRVSLGPVRRFLSADARLPVFGDDPRDPAGKKIFSAAPLEEGYLYVILGGEEYESVAQLLQGSYILRLAVWGVGGVLLFTLSAALLLFHQLTTRLRRFAVEMDGFRASTLPAAGEEPRRGGDGDEIDRLTAGFRMMADRIREQIGALEEADRTRRELVEGVSHDLRTPLATLRGYLDTLCMKEKELTPAQREEYLATAVENTLKLERRVAQLMELARLDSPNLVLRVETFPLQELVDALAEKFVLAAERRGVSLEVRALEGIPFVEADIGLVERVLENLIENALRSSKEGGKVTLSLLPEGGRAVVEVSDQGVGISAEDIPRIFEAHYQGRSPRGAARRGAGMGLAIARRIVELHGGTITVESVPGRGSAFRFDLPLSTAG